MEARRIGPIVDTSKLSRVARRRIASPPMAAVDRVGEAMRRAVEAWARTFIERVMRDVVPSIVKADATEDDIDAILNALDDPELSKKLMEEAFKSVDAASSDDLRVVGVQTSSVVRNAEQLQAEWLRQSTDLIRATEDVRRRVERILKDPVSEGRSVADIKKLLIEEAGYAASRAELTARTVTLQTYGKIQEQRQRDAGFTKYVWTTSLDERVREDHAELDGTVQEWDSPPIVDKRSGRRGHPGSDFQCRCSAVPYAEPDEVVEPIEPEPAPPAPPVEGPAPVRVAPLAPVAPAPPPVEPPVPVVPDVRPPAREAFKAHAKTFNVADGDLGDTALAALEDSGIRRVVPEGELQLEIAARPVVSNGRSGAAAGAYDYANGELQIDIRPETIAEFAEHKQLGTPDMWSVIESGTTEAERVRNLVYHEAGHAIHMGTDRLTSDIRMQIDEIVFNAGRANPAKDKKDFLSEYASMSREEYFAEAFAAYKIDPTWLKANAPRAYSMVEQVLKVRGLL